MADTTSSSPGVGATVPRQATHVAPAPTGWVGWIVFAGTMMVMVGTFHAIQGLVAIFQDQYYLVGKNGLTVHMDYTAWGWTHLILGVVVFAAGLALFTGQMWARVVGVTLLAISAIVNFGFMAAYPWWSAIIITLDVFAIWALVVHGREMKSV
jgi:hypothetical protein